MRRPTSSGVSDRERIDPQRAARNVPLEEPARRGGGSARAGALSLLDEEALDEEGSTGGLAPQDQALQSYNKISAFVGFASALGCALPASFRNVSGKVDGKQQKEQAEIGLTSKSAQTFDLPEIFQNAHSYFPTVHSRMK